jgi:GNAT superfamily N-acetyltransferase
VDPLPETDRGVTVAPLIESEIPAYLLLDRETDADTARSRMKLGHICQIARTGNRMTSAGWVAPGPGRVRVDYVESELSLAPDEVFYYAFVTDADIRGRGIGTSDWHEMRRLELKTFGPRRALAAVLPENRASLAICLKLGYVPVGRMGYIKIGPWRRDFLPRRRMASQAVLGSDPSWPAT